MVNAQTLCGSSDWRLPTLAELGTLVRMRRSNPAIDTDYFPNTPSSTFWTQSPVPGNQDLAWHITFRNGNERWGQRSLDLRIRLVRDAL
ncbi:MAG: DUF1566 domain-containing protein [Natronospirillum sp.]